MALSPAGLSRDLSSQLLEHVFDREPCCAGPCNGVGNDLIELPLALRLSVNDLLDAYEGSRALVGLKQPAQLQFTVGAHYGIRIDGKIDCKLANRRQLIPSRQRP